MGDDKRPVPIREQEPLKGALDEVGGLLHARWKAAAPGTFAKAQASFACVFFNALCKVLHMETDMTPWWSLSCAYQDMAMSHGRANATMNRVLDDHAKADAEARRAKGAAQSPAEPPARPLVEPAQSFPGLDYGPVPERATCKAGHPFSEGARLDRHNQSWCADCCCQAYVILADGGGKFFGHEPQLAPSSSNGDRKGQDDFVEPRPALAQALEALGASKSSQAPSVSPPLVHWAHPIGGCPGGDEVTHGWGRVTCLVCLTAAPKL